MRISHVDAIDQSMIQILYRDLNRNDILRTLLERKASMLHQ
jgi:hypothetical protein